MSWYSIFYWITVADGVKDFFDTFSNIFTFLALISFIIFLLLTLFANSGELDEEDKESVKYWTLMIRKLFVWFTIFMVITWAGYVFCPNKKDALTIVAGGAVGQFITSDSSARAVPSEVMTLLREKIRAEIKDIREGSDEKDITDTLLNKSKEELIELLRRQPK